MSQSVQEHDLRAKPDVVIATPGRLLDMLYNTQSFHLEDLEVLILDEADRLLDDGFKEEVEEIIKQTPSDRQTLLLSATLTQGVKDLIALALKSPLRLQADPTYSLSRNLKQEYIRVREDNSESREAIILALVKSLCKTKTIVFFRTKWHCHRMMIILGLCGISAVELHGNMTQKQRLTSLNAFQNGIFDILLATDLASRGLDIPKIEYVINSELPREIKRYIHRVGRTARAGSKGTSITICNDTERLKLKKSIKKSADLLMHRKIAKKLIEKSSQRINHLETQIKEIVEEERTEKELRLAEMEATKAENILQHKEEIENRPKKVWYQTTQEKKVAKETSKKLVEESELAAGTQFVVQGDNGKSDKAERKNRKKLQRFMKKQEQEKKPGKLQGDKLSQKLTAKSSKKGAQAKKMNKNAESQNPTNGGKKSRGRPDKKSAFAVDLSQKRARPEKVAANQAPKQPGNKKKQKKGKK